MCTRKKIDAEAAEHALDHDLLRIEPVLGLPRSSIIWKQPMPSANTAKPVQSKPDRALRGARGSTRARPVVAMMRRAGDVENTQRQS